MISPDDEAVVARQLGRPPRAIHAVGHRCPCGNPDVVTTEPRLPDGTPFPTTFYLTCPRAASRIGTLEGSGLMKEMQARLGDDKHLAAAYRKAHEAYLAARAELGDVPEIAGVTAGGMPDRVKCLHVLAAHSLAAGRGVNPLGDEVLDRLGEWWAEGPCVSGGLDTASPGGSAGTTTSGGRDASAASVSRPPVAAIDCGTNTIKLLIGTLPDVAVRESRMVRLGQGVDETGRLDDAALERAFAAVDEYAALIREHGAGPVRFCATSATRDADNAEVFAGGVEQRLGIRPDVLTGADEAALAYDGAVRNLRAPATPPVLVVDIGGGSTELILGDGAPLRSHSMDIGSVRLHERHLRSDPPTAGEVAACVADIEAMLDSSPVDPAEAATVVGVAGTITQVTAGVLDLPAYDPAVVDQAVLHRDDVHAYVERLVAMTVAERLALPYMHPGRADVIDAGALILDRVLARAGMAEMVVSEADILDGIAWSLVG